MKLKITLAIAFALSISMTYAQNLERKISLSSGDMSVGQLLTELSSRFEVKFSYSPSRIPLDKRIHIAEENISIRSVLEKSFTQAGIEFLLQEDQVVLRPKSSLVQPGVLRGKVVDKKTNLPLTFATVRLDETLLATATNSEGEFVLNIPHDQKDGSITISFIGYKNYRVHLGEPMMSLLFALEEAPVELGAVTVTTKTGLSILDEAIARVRENYDTGSVVYTYFTRDITLQKDVAVTASEAVYKAFRGSAGISPLMQVNLVKGRRAKDFTFAQHMREAFPRLREFEISTDIFSADMSARSKKDELFGKKFRELHVFELLGTSLLDDREVYVISFKQKNVNRNKSKNNGKFYIDVESLAFVRIETEIIPEGKAKLFGLSKGMALLFGFSQSEFIGVKAITNYRTWKGRWYPGSLAIFSHFVLAKKKKDFTADLNLSSNIVVTHIQTDSVKPFIDSKILKAGDKQNWGYKYTFDFWDGYNVPFDVKMEKAFHTIAKNNKENGIDMRFWEKYESRERLLRDSILCELGVPTASDTLESEELGSGSEDKLLKPTYPSLNRTYHTRNFILHYTPGDSIQALEVSLMLEDNFKRVLSDFGIQNMAKPIHAEIYPDAESYHFAIGNPQVADSNVAMAVNKYLFKMVSPASPGSYHTRESLLKAAIHEFTHCVHYTLLDPLSEKDKYNINEYSKAAWLFEAIASFEAGQLYHPEKIEYLKKGNYPSLSELNEVTNGKIYDLGFVLIEFINTTWGKSKMVDLLKQNGNIQKSLGVTESEFERKFQVYIKSAYLDGGE